MNQLQEQQPQQQQLQQQVPNYRYFKNKKTSYEPIPDGFVTSAGNPTLAAKYGNNLGANNITNQILFEAVKKDNLKS
jgi:hypothetical protein